MAVTKAIAVDDDVIPHSHPTLTLSTRHLQDDELLLSTFVHEELHWVVADSKESAAALKELRAMFATVPAQPP